MILRRVMAHFRKEEWTAIFLDFVIVVVGVFIGIQVSNWNGERQDRRTQDLYLLRLHDDIASMSAEIAEDARSARTRNSHLQTVLSYFEDQQASQLGAEQCSAIARSHIFASAIVTPPTIRELLETGGIMLIQDPELRSAIVRFQQVVEDISQLRADLQIDRRLLAREYPDLIRLGLREWEDSECRFAAMASDLAFLNDFADGLKRDGAFASDVVGRLNQLHIDLHTKLDAKLGITH